MRYATPGYSHYELTGRPAEGRGVSGGQFRVPNEPGVRFKLVPVVPAEPDRDGDVDPMPPPELHQRPGGGRRPRLRGMREILKERPFRRVA